MSTVCKLLCWKTYVCLYLSLTLVLEPVNYGLRLTICFDKRFYWHTAILICLCVTLGNCHAKYFQQRPAIPKLFII